MQDSKQHSWSELCVLQSSSAWRMASYGSWHDPWTGRTVYREALSTTPQRTTQRFHCWRECCMICSVTLLHRQRRRRWHTRMGYKHLLHQPALPCCLSCSCRYDRSSLWTWSHRRRLSTCCLWVHCWPRLYTDVATLLVCPVYVMVVTSVLSLSLIWSRVSCTIYIVSTRWCACQYIYSGRAWPSQSVDNQPTASVSMYWLGILCDWCQASLTSTWSSSCSYSATCDGVVLLMAYLSTSVAACRHMYTTLLYWTCSALAIDAYVQYAGDLLVGLVEWYLRSSTAYVMSIFGFITIFTQVVMKYLYIDIPSAT